MVVKENNIVGVLQAGGQSRRFGSPKAFATYKGVPLFYNGLHVLQETLSKCLIVSHPSLLYRFQLEDHQTDIILDQAAFLGNGPLSGLYSAMVQEKSDWYLQIACDMPLLTKEDILSIIQYAKDSHCQIDAVIPIALGYKQPLAALYHQRCFPFIKKCLEDGQYKMTSFFTDIHVQYVNCVDLGIPEEHFLNVNTQEDLNKLEHDK